MTTKVLSGARVVLPSSVINDGWVAIDGDRITAIGSGTPTRGSIDLGGAWLLPGFVDLHVHGGGGGTFADGERSARRARDFHLRHGTTTLLASVATDEPELMAASCSSLQGLCQSGAVYGIHLEGPFLSQVRRGAHPGNLLRHPDPSLLMELLESGGGYIRSVTVAPELRGSSELMSTLDAAGILVAFGHTDVDAEAMRSLLQTRAGYITHLFNGMAPMHHRDSAAAIAALIQPDCILEIVNDGVHVHPQVVSLVFRVAAGRIALVTDAISASGMPDGPYGSGNHAVVVRAGQAWTPDGRSLAGSTLTMATAVQNTVHLGVSIVDASAAASGTPARALGIASELGSIELGRRADLVVLDDALLPTRVFAGGHELLATMC